MHSPTAVMSVYSNFQEVNISNLEKRIIKAAKDLFDQSGGRSGHKLFKDFKITNTDRAFGVRLSYHVSVKFLKTSILYC